MQGDRNKPDQDKTFTANITKMGNTEIMAKKDNKYEIINFCQDYIFIRRRKKGKGNSLVWGRESDCGKEL